MDSVESKDNTRFMQMWLQAFVPGIEFDKKDGGLWIAQCDNFMQVPKYLNVKVTPSKHIRLIFGELKEGGFLLNSVSI